MTDRVKTYKLEGRALELAREFHQNSKEAMEEVNSILEAAKAEAEAVQARVEIVNRDVWYQMVQAAGISEEESRESYRNPHWRVDCSYIEAHDSAYIQQFPEQNQQPEGFDVSDIFTNGGHTVN